MKSVVFASFSVLLAAAWDGWSDCGSSDDIATLNDVTVVPDPPVKGTPLTFSFDLDVKEVVSGGTINLDLKAGDTIPIPIKETDDLCKQFEDFGGCPVQIGNLKFSIPDETIPKLIPEKHIYGTIKLARDDGKQIACIKLDAIVNLDQPSTQCKADGAECVKKEDCCNNCQERKVGGKYCCSLVGHSCTDHFQCCTKLCDREGTKKCLHQPHSNRTLQVSSSPCKAPGALCPNGPSDCCTNLCHSGTRGDQCCSGIGASCTDHFQCCTKNCDRDGTKTCMKQPEIDV